MRDFFNRFLGFARNDILGAGAFVGDFDLACVVLDGAFVGQESLGVVEDAFGGNRIIFDLGGAGIQPPCPERIVHFQHQIPVHTL